MVKLSMVQVLDNGFTCLSDIGTTCADGASFELTKLELVPASCMPVLPPI